MPSYHGKLLELLGIENKSDQYFLHIKLSFEKDIEMLWKIDEYTAESLTSITKFDKTHKYRLSFNSSWDAIQKQYVSTLTQTHLEQSQPIYFLCSEDYVNKLVSIKHSQNIRDLDTENFIPITLTTTHKHSGKWHTSNIKSPYTFIAIMSVIFTILFSYSNRIYLNKTAFIEQAFAQPTSLNNEVSDRDIEKLDSTDNSLAQNIAADQKVIPFLELDQAITYSISEGNVALTFDDGPSKYSIEIMNVLNKYQVGGTFFFTGLNVSRYPNHVKDIHSNGYSVGSHSMNHPNFPNLSYEKQENELIQSSELLEQLTGDKIVLFRPPYGAFNAQTENLADEYHYKMVLWDIDPKDWKTRDADEIFNYIQNSNVSGSIIILHESQAVLEALPRIIEYLQELDLQIVSLQ